MVVKTLDIEALETAAKQLAAQVMADFTPAFVIGVRSGGYHVAEKMMRFMPEETALLGVTCHRPGTETKKRFSAVTPLLSNMPYGVTDRLREFEHARLTRKGVQGAARPLPLVAGIEALRAPLAQASTDQTILVVDDAVDTGATLAAVTSAVRSLSDAATVKTAAITVTTHSPLMHPDYTLYSHVLCRFPWSLDFKR